MFDSAIHRRRDSALRAPADRAYQILAETVHEAAAKKDVRSEETLTAATWALMHGHAMFAMDDSFTNMEFKTPPDTLVLGPRFLRAFDGNARTEQSLTAAHRCPSLH